MELITNITLDKHRYLTTGYKINRTATSCEGIDFCEYEGAIIEY